MFELKRCREAVEVRCRGGEEMEQRRGRLCYVLGRRARVRLQGGKLLRCLARWCDWKQIGSYRNCNEVEVERAQGRV
jgi:hypothetical protein